MKKLLLVQAPAGLALPTGAPSASSQSLRHWPWDDGGLGWWGQAVELQGVIARGNFPSIYYYSLPCGITFHLT